MLSSVNRFEWIFAKMVKYENEGQGGHTWGVPFGGEVDGGALISLLILNAKFLYYTEMFLGVFYDNLW